MLILPIVDLLILAGTCSLVMGFLLKAVAVATVYNPTVLGFSSLDFVLITGVCFVMALTLTARMWVKMNEPVLQAQRRDAARAELRREARELEQAGFNDDPPGEVQAAASGDPS